MNTRNLGIINEAVLGRKVRLVIWDPTSRGEEKGEEKREKKKKGEGEEGSAAFFARVHTTARVFQGPNSHLSECHQQHLKVSTAADSRSADKFSDLVSS